MVLQMAILARLLAPGDFGLMAMVAAVIAFTQVFTDMGTSNAIIHHQNISQEALSSLYWLNVLAGAALMLLLMLLSPVVATWYQQPRMQTVLVAVSTTFLIAALGQQLRVIAEKRLLFRRLAVIELAASTLGFVVAVTVACGGGGVYALVAGMLVSVAATTALSWWVLADGWRPLWRLRLGEVREYLGFGAYMMGYSLTNIVNMQADILIGGRALGASSLGTYTLPKDLSLRLAMVLNPIVTRVGLPVMAQAQDDRPMLKSIYLKTLLMTVSVNFPIYFLMAVFAPEVVTLVFGGQWRESIPLLRILAFWGMVRSSGNPAGSLVFALGRADLAFWWSFGLMLLFAPAYWIGSRYGAEGLAWSALVSMLVIPLPQWFILIRRLCGAGFAEYFGQLAVPFVISVMSAGAGFFAAMPFEAAALRLGAGMIVGGSVYLGLSRFLNRAWLDTITAVLLGEGRSAKYSA